MLDEPLGLSAALDAAHMHGVELRRVEHVEAGPEGIARDDIDSHAVERVLQRHGAFRGRSGDVGAQLCRGGVQDDRQRGYSAFREERVENLTAQTVLVRVGDAHGGRRESQRRVEPRVFVEAGVLLVYPARGVSYAGGRAGGRAGGKYSE